MQAVINNSGMFEALFKTEQLFVKEAWKQCLLAGYIDLILLCLTSRLCYLWLMLQLLCMGLFTLPSTGSWQSFASTVWLTFHFSLDPHLSLPHAARASSGTLGSATTRGPAVIPCPHPSCREASLLLIFLLTAQSTLTGRQLIQRASLEQLLKTPKKNPSHICKCCAGICAAREQQRAYPTVPACKRWCLVNEETWPLAALAHDPP